MKILALALVILAAVIDGPGAEAADLSPSVREAPRARFYVRRAHVGIRRDFVYRTIGMPCVLPPNVIVRRNWNGPQCRWVDNVIPGDLRVRYRVAARW